MNSALSPKSSLARVSAIILAAGTSRRMGQAKQLLPLGGSTILAQTIQNVRSATLHQKILVLGSSADAISRQLPSALLEGLKVVVNQGYRQGIASSLHEGLSALDQQSDAALIILGDQPFIRSQTLDQLIESYRHSRAQVVIPSYRGTRGNPVLLDRSLFPEVMQLEGDIGCRAIFGKHLDGILNVEVEDVGVLLDIDNLEDYDRLKIRG
jgi:molybdenum cofactor cytidylyltransferase